jgi:peptidoglycan/xylan/chitin deacetylase (PgdA/CDA1 family)
MTEALANPTTPAKLNPAGGLRAKVFLSAAQQELFLRGTPALMYHKIAAPPAATIDPFLYLRPQHLEQHLRLLVQAGFSPAPIAQGLQAPDNRAKHFVVTFDDGCQNVLENGLEVLLRQQVPAIQFLVAGALGGVNQWDVACGDVPQRLMDASQVREWMAAGQQIGSHSLTHPNLKALSPAEIREEVGASRKRLEDLFGVPVRHFSYPFGCSNQTVEELVAEAGYESACGVKFGVNNQSSPRFALRRIHPLSASDWVRKASHRLARLLRPRRLPPG